jgi:hypothetical protein
MTFREQAIELMKKQTVVDIVTDDGIEFSIYETSEFGDDGWTDEYTNDLVEEIFATAKEAVDSTFDYLAEENYVISFVR